MTDEDKEALREIRELLDKTLYAYTEFLRMANAILGGLSVLLDESFRITRALTPPSDESTRDPVQ